MLLLLSCPAYAAPPSRKQTARDFVTELASRQYARAVSRFDPTMKQVSPQVRCKLYPGLNDLFMPGTGTISPAEYQKPAHVSESVLNVIAEWGRSSHWQLILILV